MRSPLRSGLALAVLLAGSSWAAAQTKVDEKKIAELEKKVAILEGKLREQVAKLRESYRTLDRELSDARKIDDGARMVAEVTRVIEPPLREARSLLAKPTAANRAKALAAVRKGIPEALGKVEMKPLLLLQDYLVPRLLGMLQDAQALQTTLGRTDEDLARQVIQDVIADATPFHERWNAHLAESLKSVGAYRKAFKEVEDAKNDLMVARDPLLAFQIGAPPGFARVPGGAYTVPFTEGFIGTGARKREKSVVLPRDLYIGLREITVQEYDEWLKSLTEEERKRHLPKDAAGKELWPKPPGAPMPIPEATTLANPVTGVTFQSAMTYAAAHGARLPTEEEWAAAAAGPDKRKYPWGDEWEANRCNDRESGAGALKPAGSYPEGRGAFGHFDLAGNAAEWVMTYESGKSVEAEKIEDQNVAVRGGSFMSAKKDVACGWVWLKRSMFDQDVETGFRLARDP